MRAVALSAPISAVLSALLFALPASAHDPFEITTDVRVHVDQLNVTITMARSTAQKACLPASDASPRFERSEFDALRPALAACAARLYAISAGDQRLEPRDIHVELTPENDVESRLVYPPARSSPLRFDGAYLKKLPDPAYGAVLTVSAPDRFFGQQLLNAEVSALEIEIPTASNAELGRAAPPVQAPSFVEYLRLGVEHILTGYDHLLFLAGLFAVCRRWASVFAIVTSFTLAHSLTLALAVLDLVTLPSRLVEPLIAASIVFVGLENLLRGQEPKGRWALSFGFGLIHGFGFAGVLGELGLGSNGSSIALPLFAFNLGVELGQAALALVFLPLAWQLRRVPVIARHGTLLLSLGVAGAGLYWLLDRTLYS